MAENTSASEGRTVGPKEQVGAGVLAMGIFVIVLPFAVAEAVSADSAFITLWAMNVLAGLFLIGASIAVFRLKE